MISVFLTTKFSVKDTAVVATVRGMEVLVDERTGEPRVILDDYDVSYAASGGLVPAEILDANETLAEEIEAQIEEVIIPARKEAAAA